MAMVSNANGFWKHNRTLRQNLAVEYVAWLLVVHIRKVVGSNIKAAFPSGGFQSISPSMEEISEMVTKIRQPTPRSTFFSIHSVLLSKHLTLLNLRVVK